MKMMSVIQILYVFVFFSKALTLDPEVGARSDSRPSSVGAGVACKVGAVLLPLEPSAAPLLHAPLQHALYALQVPTWMQGLWELCRITDQKRSRFIIPLTLNSTFNWKSF